MVEHRGAARDRRARQREGEPRVVELPVPVAHRAREALHPQSLREAQRLRGAQELGAALALLAGEQVIDQ
jgi:hypothetical protein